MYFTVQITRKNNETAKAIFSFDTLKEANANHFYFLASAYADKDNDYILGLVIDENGYIIEKTQYREDK